MEKGPGSRADTRPRGCAVCQEPLFEVPLRCPGCEAQQHARCAPADGRCQACGAAGAVPAFQPLLRDRRPPAGDGRGFREELLQALDPRRWRWHAFLPIPLFLAAAWVYLTSDTLDQAMVAGARGPTSVKALGLVALLFCLAAYYLGPPALPLVLRQEHPEPSRGEAWAVRCAVLLLLGRVVYGLVRDFG